MNSPKVLATTLSLLLLLAWYPLLCTSTVKLPAVHGRFVYEFYTYLNSDTNKLLQAAEWTAYSPMSTGRTSTCGTWFMLGGIGVLNSGGYFERTYANLPPSHNIMFFVINLVIVGTWTAGDTVSLQFDSASPLVYYPSVAKTNYGTTLCSGTFYGLYYTIIGQAIHGGTSLIFKVISGVPGGIGAVGINSVKFNFYQDTSGMTAYTCTPYSSGTLGYTCTCQAGTYPPSCLTCNIACDNCYGGADTQCYGCNTAAGYYWSGTRCVLGCPTGCQICAPDTGRCSVCLPTHALAWDYTCRATCIAPLYIETTGDYKFCLTPCQATNTFMLWTGVCTVNCDYPLQSRIETNAKFCDYPCNIALNQYLYVNGTCSTRCDFIKRIQGSYRFCDPCNPTTDYYNWENVCVSTCTSPMRPRIEGTYKACERPCNSDLAYYYVRDGICRYVCKYPYKIKDTAYCVLDLPDSEVEGLNLIGDTLGTTGAVLSAAGVVLSAANYGSPGPIFIYALSDLLKYIRYINVAYPPKLEYLFNEQDSYGDLVPFIPQIPDEVTEVFIKFTLPEKFEYYRVHSSFFVNTWEPLLIIVATLIVIIILVILTSLTTKGSTTHKVMSKIKEAFKWNFFLAIFDAFYANIIVNTSLEARTLDFDFFYNTLSFIVCVLFNVLLLVVVIWIIVIIMKLWNAKPSKTLGDCFKQEFQAIQSNYRDYAVIFDDFNSDSLLQFAFVPLFALRLCLFAAVIGYLFEYPLMQAMVLVLISGVMVVYLITTSPFKNIVDLIVFLLQEVLFFIVNICILILAVLDQSEVLAINHRAKMGELIIVISFISAGAAVLYFAFQALRILKFIYDYLASHWLKSQQNKVDPNADFHNTTKDITRNEASGLQGDSINNLELSSNLVKPKFHSIGLPNPYRDGPVAYSSQHLDETIEPITNPLRLPHVDNDMAWEANGPASKYISRQNSAKRSRSATPMQYSPRQSSEHVFGYGGARNYVDPAPVSPIYVEELTSVSPIYNDPNEMPLPAIIPKSRPANDWTGNKAKRKK